MDPKGGDRSGAVPSRQAGPGIDTVSVLLWGNRVAS
jgi:hypothetical protein